MQNNNDGLGSKNEKIWIVFGDIHDQTANINKIPELASADAIIISGDLTQLGACPQAEKVLASLPSLPVYAQIGNMDKAEVDGCLSEKSHNLHGQVYQLSPDIALFGIGGSTITPFHTPNEFSEEEYTQWLEEAWLEASKFPKRILISHNPPKNSNCDKISTGAHVGSTAVRKFIEEKQPDLCVCGHIHEAKGTDRIGKTLVLNPGMISEGAYVLISETGGKLKAEIKEIPAS